MTDQEGFKITGHGFQITFPNLIMVSVQFNSGNYCQRGRERVTPDESPDAEIAIIDTTLKHSLTLNSFITKEFKDDDDDVLGWQKPTEVLKALTWAEQYVRERSK